MTKIIGLVGKKQSGKNSAANGIVAYIMKQIGMVEWAEVNDLGKLAVPALMGENEDGSPKIERRVLDLDDNNPEVQSFLAEYLHPAVKTYSFAFPLKSIAMNVFGLTWEQCFGTDEQKNTPTTIQWKNMPGKIKSPTSKAGAKEYLETFVTGREFLQFFGTEVCRKIKDNCWIDYCINQIKTEQSNLAIITDVRFTNEAKAIKEAGGYVIYLTRNVAKTEDKHSSETELESIKEFTDFICENQGLSITEQNEQIINKLKELQIVE